MTATLHCRVVVWTALSTCSRQRAWTTWSCGLAPEVVHILIPGACYLIHSYCKQDFADVIKATDLEMGRLTWIIWETSSHKCSSESCRDRGASQMSVARQMLVMSPGTGQPQKLHKARQQVVS